MVYVDLLVIEDLFLNYIVLLGTSILLNRTTNLKKIFLSSVIGLIPLVFLFTNLNKITVFIINFLFSIPMSLIAFKFKDILYTIKNILYMYFISIFLAGSLYLINTNFLPDINSYILNVLILLILSPIITYIYLKSLSKIKNINSNYYHVDIYLKDKPKITLNGYLDTGNKLIDPYTFKPIILVSKKIINYSPSKYIFVPYNTIDSEGIIKCFKPEKIYIDKVGYRTKVLIGLIDSVNIEGADCILNQKLIERI